MLFLQPSSRSSDRALASFPAVRCIVAPARFRPLSPPFAVLFVRLGCLRDLSDRRVAITYFCFLMLSLAATLIIVANSNSSMCETSSGSHIQIFFFRPTHLGNQMDTSLVRSYRPRDLSAVRSRSLPTSAELSFVFVCGDRARSIVFVWRLLPYPLVA